MPRRLLIVLSALLGWLALAPAAHAVWFAAEPVDGPSADLLGPKISVDVGDDGGGAIVYRKLDGGVPHVFTARLVNGAFQPPRRVDAGIADAASEAVAVAGEGGRLAYFWLAGTRLYGALEGGAPTLVYDSGGAPLAGLDADMGVNGTAYAVFGAGGDVRAARLFKRAFAALAEPLDIDPARDAGAPRVAVGADGNAVAVWLEAGHVFARRLLGTGLSVVPQEGTLPGGAADSADISIEDDTMFAWVVFRQDIGGASRAVARRFIGSAFDPPVLMDLGGGAGAPAVGINGRGQGVFAVPAGGAALGSYVGITDVFEPLVRLDTTGGVGETVAEGSDIRDAVLAWRAGGSVSAAFRRERGPFDPPAVLSRPEFGPVVPGSLALASDWRADMLLAMLQDDPAGRRLVAAGWDRPPSPPYMLPRRVFPAQYLIWGPAGDAWGVTYNVAVDGVAVGTSAFPRLNLARPLANGRHTIAVTAVDRHGQTAAMPPAQIRVDGYIPRVRATVRRSGRVVRVSIRARDRGTGIGSYRVYWGDKSRPARGAQAAHAYRPGRYRLVALARDRAGNAGRKVVSVRIR